MNLFWRIIREIYRAHYGVRGGLKPPVNYNRANTLGYRWRHKMWKLESAIYARTGLPEQWNAWIDPTP